MACLQFQYSSCLVQVQTIVIKSIYLSSAVLKSMFYLIKQTKFGEGYTHEKKKRAKVCPTCEVKVGLRPLQHLASRTSAQGHDFDWRLFKIKEIRKPILYNSPSF